MFTLVTNMEAVKTNKRPLHEDTPDPDELFQAIEDSDADCVKRLLQSGVDVNARRSRQFGVTPIYLAFYGRKMAIIPLLLSDPFVNLNALNKTGKCDTVLHLAVTRKDPVSVRLFLERGADPMLHSGRPMLSLAVRTLCYENVKLLLDYGADVNYRIPGEKPILHTCMSLYSYPNLHAIGSNCNRNLTGIIEVLLQHGADHTQFDSRSSRETPLFSAVRHGYTDGVALLIKYGAEINLVNQYHSQIPLHIAAASVHNNLEIVEMLVKHGSRLNTEDIFGRSPLGLRTDSNGCRLLENLNEINSIAYLMVSHGADINKANLNLMDNILFSGETFISDCRFYLFALEAGLRGKHDAEFISSLESRKGVAPELLQSIKNIVTNTRSLVKLCRDRVRTQLIVASGDTSIYDVVEELPVPKTVKSFLLLKDLEDMSFLDH